jgi:hypothetical protein
MAWVPHDQVVKWAVCKSLAIINQQISKDHLKALSIHKPQKDHHN